MKERLLVLKEGSAIDEAVYNDCIALHDGIMTLEGLTELNAYSVAMTHLAMAMQRIKQGTVVDYMDDMILSEIKSADVFDEVKDLTSRVVEQLSVSIPESEVQFLWLHLVNTLNEKGGN